MTASDPRVGEIQDYADCLGCPDCGTTLTKRNPEVIALRLSKVSDGPWTAWDRGIGYEVHGPHGEPINDRHRETFTRGDAEFIATAPADVAYLLAQLRARDEALADAKAEALRRAANEIARLKDIGRKPIAGCTEDEKADYYTYAQTTPDQWLRARAAELRKP